MNLQFDKEMRMIERKKKDSQLRLSNSSIELAQKKLSFESFQKDCDYAENTVRKMESEHPWINDQKQ